MQIALTGGGSGGHAYPLLAVLRRAKAIAEAEGMGDIRFWYIGRNEETADLFRKEGAGFIRIHAGKLRTYASGKNILAPFVMLIGVLEALAKLFFVMPDALFSKGGAVSFPATLAAAIYRIPIIIHESDSVPGRANSWMARFATRIAISFPETASRMPRERTALTGNPIRDELLAPASEEGKRALGLAGGRPVIFVSGGSQGAQRINNAIIEILGKLIERYEIIHQTGAANLAEIRVETADLAKSPNGRFYHTVAFLDAPAMRASYEAANLVVSRAGSSIFEIAAVGKPSILIPLAIAARDHQRENAFAYAGRGAALVIEEANLTPTLLAFEIEKLMADEARRAAMAKAALEFAKPRAAEIIARELLTLAKH